MIRIKYTVLLICLVGSLEMSTSASFDTEKSPARVLISEDRSIEDGYMVEIEANGNTRQLRLTPMENIWSADAQSLIISENKDGELIYEVKNIPQDIKVYHDSATGSVLSVEQGKLNGILDSDYTIKSEEGQHFVIKTDKKDFDKFDYKRVPKDIPKANKRIFKESSNTMKIPMPIMNKNYRQASSFVGEVCVIVDSISASEIGTDSQIYEYLTIFYNAVKKRYQTIKDPLINVRLVGTVIIRTPSGEPFITNNLNGDKVYGEKALYSLGAWVFQMLSSLPAFDLCYCHTGRDEIDSNGTLDLGGIAFMGSACIKNDGDSKTMAVGIGEDIGAYFSGVHICTHEIAHILGSPHDGDAKDGTSACLWSDGYIMSYVDNLINHMFFSSCSIHNMTVYLSSDDAACVLSNLAQTQPPGVYNSTNLPGDKITMKQQCQKITGNSQADVYVGDEPESSLCYNLRCQYPDADGEIWTMETFDSAAEGAACPTSGKCSDGACV